MVRKKILFVITKSNWGGAQRYVYDLATNLLAEGMTVKIALGGTGTAGATPGALAERLREAGIEVIFVRSFMRNISMWHECVALFELLKIFEGERPDAIHLNSSKAGGIGALAGRIAGVRKIVFTSHGLAYDEDRSLFARALIWIATWITFLLCHHVIVISQDTFKRARQMPFCRSKIHLVYNGIEEINFAERDEARIKIMGNPIRKEIPWIGTVVEFTKNKGVSYLVEAASILKKRGLEFRLCLIGHGEDLPKIKKQAIGSGLYNAPGSRAYIDLPGFVPNFAKWMKAFAIFVLPSVKEGLPYVLLEAGQAGCAVVGTAIPGITDIIDESTGILIPPKNPQALADALEKLLRNPVKQTELGENLKKRVAERFSIKKMLNETVELY